MKRGPGNYDVSHRLTEMRTDKGVMKIKEPYYEIKEEVEEDERPALYPNFDIDKPNKLVFKYYEPSKDVGPQNTPEKDLFPERWHFYDINLRAVREDIAKEIDFAQNMERNRFIEH